MNVTQVALCPTFASHAAGRPALTPELLAATGARYSRSNDGLEEKNLCYTIYALRDPRDQEIRYVGITRQTIRRRMNSHLRNARKGATWHSAQWMRQLLRENLLPLVEILEKTNDPEREMFWIAYCCAQGYRLTNKTSGGISGYRHTTEARAKISQAGQNRFKDLTGQQVGRLTILEIAAHQPLRWLCVCSCGRQVVIKAQSFSSRGVRSCGCLSREQAAQRARERTKHGMWRSKEYLTWLGMRARCGNPRHARYECNGGRGIAVCPEWNDSFEQFLADMGPKPENKVLMRKDKTQNDSPQNCVWATRSELRKPSP